MVHFLFDLFFNAVRRNAMEDEEEARALVLKRANKHAGIPALNVVRSHFGPRFDELLDQMVSGWRW